MKTKKIAILGGWYIKRKDYYLAYSEVKREGIFVTRKADVLEHVTKPAKNYIKWQGIEIYNRTFKGI